MKRRTFLKAAGCVLGAGAAAELCWVAGSFLKPGQYVSDGDVTAFTALGKVKDFAKPSVTSFPEHRLHLVRLEDGGFLAMSNLCTHLGCVVPWIPKQGRFVCPCHASAFDRTGNVESPPAPRALDLHPVQILDAVVKVDLRGRVRRDGYRKDQVVYVEGQDK